MSAGNAAAKKRRAPPGDITPAQNNIRTQTSQNNVNQTGLTLPQVITIIDNRLIKLETFVKESSTNVDVSATSETQSTSPDVSQWINEFNNRFEILAEEIGNLKDIVLKLQSYTMDINKTLLEERINVFSDLTNTKQSSENIILQPIEKLNNDDSVTSLNLQNLVSQELKSI
jgi:hypothetical protein